MGNSTASEGTTITDRATGNSTVSDGEEPEDTIEILPDVIRGKADWREYRPLKLPNGVTCMLVHDKESKTTAMAACVHTGAAADPRSLSGLAHFTEHMCFLGSEKYPGENEYKRYLSCHGGRSNASTSMHLTTYKFDVLADHAETAVDMFANFFVSPLFTPSGTSREVQAVDSEDSKNRTADSRRRLQILKAMADPDHYYSKFSTGNETTLNTAEDDEQTEWVRDALLTFHRYHYQPENMTVVIVGPQSLDTLQEWVVPRFASMEPKDFPANEDNWTEAEILIHEAANEAPSDVHDEPLPPFNPAFRPELQGGTWPVLLTSRPVRSMRKLVLNFPLPSTRRTPDQSPSRLLSHLLGHEGPGSSFAVLQNAGLISSLSAGPRVSGPDQCLFQLSIALTEEGEERWQDVVDILFAHCRLLHSTALAAKKEEGTAREDLQRLWGETATLGRIHFDLTSPNQAYDFAPGLAQSIVVYGIPECVSAGNMLNENDDTLPLDQFAEFTSRLVPSNCIVERCSHAAWDEMQSMEESEDKDTDSTFGKKTEKWYGVEYYVTDIEPGTVESWIGIESVDMASGTDSDESLNQTHYESLHLPRPNRYIPRTLDLCPDLPEEAKLGPRIEKEIDPPNLIIDKKGFGRLWHRLDDRYALPKSSLTFLIRNAAVDSIRNEKDGTWTYNVDAAIQSAILSGIFSEALAQDTYDASLAGLSWSLSTSSSGIHLGCSGYSDRLPDLALKLLNDFLLTEPSESFFQESYFVSTKDRLVRGLRTYFQSRRADSHARYYRDLLLSSKEEGVDKSLAAAEATTLESLKEQHKLLLLNEEVEVDCLFTGNVSEADAKEFFANASDILQKIPRSAATTAPNTTSPMPWIPGPLERRLVPGEDVELHFASKNPEEENGSVLVTYQSQTPGYKGDGLSHPESLKESAAIRLICHMLREPLFDDLRTKQQLGYIVSSYNDVGFASFPQDPLVTPVDTIVIHVLSRKVPTPEVALRIDEFLDGFRDTLMDMPASEIRDHADALSKKLLKPIQKLGSEASIHFGKIRRYGPEVLASGGQAEDLPWDSVKSLADAIQSLDRKDLVATWDRVVAVKTARSRVVSCVYGKTFPLEEKQLKPARHTKQVVNNLDRLLALRKELKPFDKSPVEPKRPVIARLWGKLSRSKSTLGIAAVAVIGVGVVGFTVTRRYKKQGL